MSNWITVKIADIGEVIGGSTPSTTNDEYYGGDIAWITPKDLSNFDGRFISYGERNITKTGLESCSARLLPKHTILFTSRAPIGYIAISSNELATNQGFKSIIPNEKIDYLFLYYLLKYNKDKIESMGSGTTFKEVSGVTMKNIEVQIPQDKNEQKKIAAILSSLDDKIELNTRMNKVLEEIARALFHRWFVEFEFPNDEGKPYKSSGGRMIESEMGEIPEGWRVVSFRDFLIPRNEKSNDPAIPEYSVTNGGIQLRDEKFKKKLSASTSKNKIIHQYDLIFGMSREVLNWGLMKEGIGGVSSAYNVFIVDKQINPFYLESFMLQHPSYFKDIIKPAAREGQGIDKAALFAKYLCIPSSELLEQYYQIEKSVTLTRVHLENEKDCLVQVRDNLLQKLITFADSIVNR
ncbi:hypothetical protein McpSp1_17390 [Methanocorpusculaceae archaeon Sp1]|nr:hypothetical protein [Methanocorpusculaceae archaeon Sp1]